MKRSTKKGFTIVELVIVIAIIAILAAVLIPTFASLIQKANTSADIQAVRQMNTYLAINEVDEPKTINEVFKALENGGMTAKDYHPLVSGRFFFWDRTLNRVLYTDDQYNVIFPEDYKTAKPENGWLSLSGEIREDKVDFTGNVVEISTAGQYYAFAKANKNLTAGKTVQFTVDTIDLMGADVGLQISAVGDYTISGKDGGTTIKGLSQLKYNYTGTAGAGDNAGKNYGSGLIQAINTNKAEGDTTVTIENITISGGTFGDLETGGVAAVVGKVLNSKAVTVNFNNVKVENTVINGKNKVGVLVGQAMGKTYINVDKDCKIKNVTVNCSEGEAGKVIGCLSTSGDSLLKVDIAFTELVENVTLNLVEGKHKRETVMLGAETDVTVTATYDKDGKLVTTGVPAEQPSKTKATALVQKKDITNGEVVDGGWRLFFKDAYVTAIYDGTQHSIQVVNEKTNLLDKYTTGYNWGKTQATIDGKAGYEKFVFTTAYCGK